MAEEETQYLTPERIREMVKDLEKRMKQAARKLEFEEAALLRDEIRALEQQELEMK
jgi:excinuclease ABC subunit B